MIKFIRIQNFALAEDLKVSFEPGLNIITGETGAGKSILVGAIGAVLGDRTSLDVIRTGAERAFIEAIFDISALPELKRRLEELGIEVEDELFLRREISLKRGSRAFINDVQVAINTLSEIGDYLVDIHGQHEHQMLLKSETHRYFLDSFGQLQPLIKDVSEKYERLKEVEQSLSALQKKQSELNEKYDLYEFQLKEISAAHLEPDEDVKLEEERKLLVNAEKLFEISSQLEQIFEGTEVSLLDLISQAERLLRTLSEYSGEMAQFYQEYSSSKIVFEETARSIEEFKEHLEFDPNRLEDIESRLNQIRMLKKKYGETISDVLAYAEQLRKDLALKENFDFEVKALQKKLEEATAAFSEAAIRLSAARRETSKKLEKAVQEKLENLGMPKTRFQVRMDWVEDPHGYLIHEGQRYQANEWGADEIEFYISPNPGEDYKPLAKIASGGEISRIMLALKTILASIDQIPTLIFDEIDIGVSGRIAQAVGRSIRALGENYQIICITHLPQIAAQGKTHLVVKKFVRNNRTYTTVEQLSQEQQIEEIARLMSGERITKSVRESAKQLIEENREVNT